MSTALAPLHLLLFGETLVDNGIHNASRPLRERHTNPYALLLRSHANSHLRRTLSVGVDEPYVTASEPPRNGNIDCNRGFAYSALRIANSDNHLNPFLILKKIFNKSF